MFGSSFGDLVIRRMWSHWTHRLWMSSTSLRSMPSSSLMYAELRSRFAFKFVAFRCLSPLSNCRSRPDRLLRRVFRVCGQRPRRISAWQPCEPSEDVFQTSSPPSKVAGVGFSAWAPPHLFSLLPCYVHLNLHIRTRAPTLCFARAHRTWCQLGRSGKHDVGHVGGDVTNAGIIED